MKVIRKAAVNDPKHAEPVWFLTFDRIDHIAFRHWADTNGIRYRFTWEGNRVQLFTETDALLCYLSFV